MVDQQILQAHLVGLQAAVVGAEGFRVSDRLRGLERAALAAALSKTGASCAILFPSSINVVGESAMAWNHEHSCATSPNARRVSINATQPQPSTYALSVATSWASLSTMMDFMEDLVAKTTVL